MDRPIWEYPVLFAGGFQLFAWTLSLYRRVVVKLIRSRMPL